MFFSFDWWIVTDLIDIYQDWVSSKSDLLYNAGVTMSFLSTLLFLILEPHQLFYSTTGILVRYSAVLFSREIIEFENYDDV